MALILPPKEALDCSLIILCWMDCVGVGSGRRRLPYGRMAQIYKKWCLWRLPCGIFLPSGGSIMRIYAKNAKEYSFRISLYDIVAAVAAVVCAVVWDRRVRRVAGGGQSVRSLFAVLFAACLPSCSPSCSLSCLPSVRYLFAVLFASRRNRGRFSRGGSMCEGGMGEECRMFCVVSLFSSLCVG